MERGGSASPAEVVASALEPYNSVMKSVMTVDSQTVMSTICNSRGAGERLPPPFTLNIGERRGGKNSREQEEDRYNVSRS